MLFRLDVSDSAWTELQPKAPYYFFVPKDLSLEAAYNAGFSITALMKQRVTGIITARDSLSVDFDLQTEVSKLQRFVDPNRSDVEVRASFFGDRSVENTGDTRGWNLSDARTRLAQLDLHSLIRPIDYRLFDRRSIAYTPLLVDWGREKFMRHMIEQPNLALVTCRQGVGAAWANAFLSDTIGDDSYLSNRSRERGYYFPLYLLSGRDNSLFGSRATNLDQKYIAVICAAAGIDPASDADSNKDFRAATGDDRPNEMKVFDYLYGVLHAPNYRAKFAEFLKVDFPRIPYPASPAVFRAIGEKGEQLRRLHLVEAAAVGDTPYPFTGEGDDMVAAGYPIFDDGRVCINPNQFFDSSPPAAWAFQIGGYQPAQKWLKDRRGRTLSWDEIGHYQKILRILAETDRIMREIALPLPA